MDQKIGQKASEAVAQIQMELEEAKLSREESETAILDMLKQVVRRVKAEIESERRDREAMEETILNLIEETCAKLLNQVGNEL